MRFDTVARPAASGATGGSPGAGDRAGHAPSEGSTLSSSPVAPIASRESRIPRPAPPSALSVLLLIALITLGARLVVLPGSTESNMDADAAHFMNVARCFARGEGFSNPAAWPAWMRPERLPMPETFKEPGYPWAISKLTPLAGSPFRAGQLLSLVAGLLTPFLTWMLARRLDPDRAVADLAGLIAAASPLLIAQSARVMVESVFAAVFTLLWVLLAPPPAAPNYGRRARDLALDVAAGVTLGLAVLLRLQTLMAAPAIAVLLLTGSRTLRVAIGRAGVVLAAAAVTASPFLVRNLSLFGTPLYSDIPACGLLAYRNAIDLFSTLERPESAIGYAFHHVPQVLTHMVVSAGRFFVRTLPGTLLGHPVWMVPLAAGVALSLAHRRRWLFVHVQLLVTLTFVFAINWDARYFASSVPLWCVLAAPGAVWLARALGPAPLAGRFSARHLLGATLAALLVLGPLTARHDVVDQVAPENAAARAEAPFLRSHLAADEAVMVLTTSYYAYWSDRHAAYLVIADEPGFTSAVRRLHVRYAALPTSQLADLARRYPDHKLPAALAVDHVDAALDVTMFRVRDPEAAPGR